MLQSSNTPTNRDISGLNDTHDLLHFMMFSRFLDHFRLLLLLAKMTVFDFQFVSLIFVQFNLIFNNNNTKLHLREFNLNHILIVVNQDEKKEGSIMIA